MNSGNVKDEFMNETLSNNVNLISFHLKKIQKLVNAQDNHSGIN